MLHMKTIICLVLVTLAVGCGEERVIEGHYKDGKIDGLVHSWDRDGQKGRLRFKDGERVD